EVAGHGVHRFREIPPRAADAFHVGLTAEFSFRTHFARHARYFRGERVELVDHRVDGVFQLENFSARVYSNFARQIALGHGGGHAGDVTHLVGKIAGHRVDRLGQIAPRPRDAPDLCLPAQLAFRTHFARHARYFRRESVELIHHRVDGVFELQ